MSLCVHVCVYFCLCVCKGGVSRSMCVSAGYIWPTAWLSYLQGNSEGLLESHPNCEVNDVRQLTDAVFLHIHLPVGKKERTDFNLWNINNTERRGIFEKKMCRVIGTRCPPENWLVEVTSQLMFGYRERRQQPRFILAVTKKLRLKSLLKLTECFVYLPIRKEQRL